MSESLLSFEERTDWEVVPKDFMHKSDTIAPLHENNNDFRLNSGTNAPNVQCVCSGGMCICESKETSPMNESPPRSYGSASPSPSPEPVDPLTVSIRCGCHDQVAEKTSRKARTKLVIACIIALVFVVGEVIGQ